LALVNLTDHELCLIDPETGRQVVLPSAGRARVSSFNDVQEYVELEGVRIPIVQVVERTLYQLPEPEEGTLYIVSGLVAATAHRSDVVSPARLKRDSGRVIGARALLRH
jgi:hypothetical protein